MRLYADYLTSEYGAMDSDYVFVNRVPEMMRTERDAGIAGCPWFRDAPPEGQAYPYGTIAEGPATHVLALRSMLQRPASFQIFVILSDCQSSIWPIRRNAASRT
jgi:hypothetical protein